MWLKIKVLLWKSFKLRTEHWFISIIEILFPCLLFYMLYYMHNDDAKVDNALRTEKFMISSSISEAMLEEKFTKDYDTGFFIYTPKTLVTEEIMKIVTKNLNISPNNIETADSEQEIIKKFKKLYNSSPKDISNLKGFGIVFQKIEKSIAFTYKIRSTNDFWETNELFPSYTKNYIKPLNSGDIYFKSGFITLQLTLDKAFIDFSLSNIKNDYKFNIQSYPYVIQSNKYSLLNMVDPLLLTVLSFLVMFSFTIKRVSEEKESGVKELMKMMGLKSWMLWTGWVLHNLFFNVIIISIITYICCFLSTNVQLFNDTNPYIYWIFLVMYTLAGTFYCFAISSLFHSSIIALIVGIIVWLSTDCVYPFFLSSENIIIRTLLMLHSNVLLQYGYTFISPQSVKSNIKQLTLFTTEEDHTYFPTTTILGMFLAQCFFYGFIAWYFDSVMPGKYGIAKPFNFLCKWSNKKTESIIMAPLTKKNSKLFEKIPNTHEVGISVQNLHKHYGDFHAVNGVNLELYKGQITVLLGHNGAGKTTTMSIITGMFSPSYGTVEFNGNDIFDNIDLFRANLGLCPQHNLLFPYLRTLDHLIFFGMLKGLTRKQAKSEGLHLLKLLNISQKYDKRVSSLSGGMKRKVSLAISLIGNSEILILDEPTSGMDPESRREMWDLLLSFRGSRTILITTHFMEEADALADKIAIMDHGQVTCYGTPIFLKKVLGTGYNLTIVKEESCSETKIVTAIKQIIPKAEVQRSVSAQIVVNLPESEINKYPDLFKMLEKNRTDFCIKGMGVSCITMEEVFLSISINDTKVGEMKFKTSKKTNAIQPAIRKTSGIRLLKNQFIVLLRKKILYTYRKWPMTFFLGVIPILLGIFTITSTTVKIKTNENKELEMSLSIYKDSSVYYRAGDNSSENLEPTFVAISKVHKSTVNEASSTNIIIDDLLNMCKQDVFKYKMNLMIAGDFNNTDATIIYNNIATHTPAIAVNLYTNAVLRKLSGNTESSISTFNEPITFKIFGACSNFDTNLLTWHIIFVPSFLFLIGYIQALPLDERMSGFKHLQMMTKLSPIMYWSTCFIWDYLCYIIIVIFTLLFLYIFDTDHIFTNENALYVFLILLLIYGWSSIFHVYVYTFFNKNLSGSMLCFLSINFMLGLIYTLIMVFMINKFIYTQINIYPYNILNIVRCITLLIPQFAFSTCMYGFLTISWENKKCELCKISTKEQVCSDLKRKSYFVFRSNENEFGILEETLFLLFSSLLYIIIILLFEYKIFARLYQCSFNKIVNPNDIHKDDKEDPDVGIERNKVYATQTNLDNTLSPLFIVDNLVKKFSTKFTAVRGISFTVLPGECFGLLGINGAGKSTTFRMLTGDLLPSRGDASIHLNKVYKLSSNISQYVSMIGYCPQYDALNGQLTSKETLHIMAILRGISTSNSKIHIDKWLKLLGLEEYSNKPCGNYSGGNKRKLNTAIALIGDPPMVFLDEPTSGVDPVSRRNLWEVMGMSRREGQAVILTSHSMDECEALCNRLTVMVDGQMKCIGNIQYLKSRYGLGFTVVVKLRNDDNTRVAEIKAYIERQFAPDIHLKDEHKGFLEYHITNPKKELSDIFTTMIAIKKSYTEIEDYTVGDTSLEQVFLAFAKHQEARNA